MLAAALAAAIGLAVWAALRRPRRRVAGALLAANDHLRRLAETDPLSGVANARVLRERLADEVAASHAAARPLSVAMLDLDEFKSVNDAHGHAAGDAVLAEAARRLAATVRPGDLVARVGGEEFALVLPGAGAAEAVAVVERARGAVRSGDHPDGVGPVTASAGVAELMDGLDAEALLRRADRALYRAKERGRDATVLAPADDDPTVDRVSRSGR